MAAWACLDVVADSKANCIKVQNNKTIRFNIVRSVLGAVSHVNPQK